MQNDFKDKGLAIVGVTRSDGVEAQQFQIEYGLNYPVIATADPLFDAYGVKAVWGSVVYLIGPDNTIRARGLKETRTVLEGAGLEGAKAPGSS